MSVHTHPPLHPCLLQTDLLLLSASPCWVLGPLWPQTPFLSSWAWYPLYPQGYPQPLAPENPVGSHQASWVFASGLSSEGAQDLPMDCRNPPSLARVSLIPGESWAGTLEPQLLTWDQLLESASLGVTVSGKRGRRLKVMGILRPIPPSPRLCWARGR